MDAIERRQVLLTAVGGSLLALATADETKAQAKFTILGVESKVLTGIPVKPPKNTDPAEEVAAWSEIKSRVSQAVSALKVFDNSFEERALPDLNKIASEERNIFTHNPRLVEPLLGEIASLLDRCLSYRREGAELELAGVAAGAARIASDALLDIDRKIAAIDVSRDAAEILAKNYPDVAASYEKAADRELGVGNSYQLRVQAEANTKVSERSLERGNLVLGKLVYTQEIERQMQGRHDVSCNAHNYSERFERLAKLYQSDITTAYRRALAASAGLASLFEFTTAVPTPSENGFLDKLVIWTRDAMRAVTLVGEREIELIKLIPIPIPTASTGSASIDKLFDGFKMVRLKSIAASFTLDGGDTKNTNEGNGSIGVLLVKSDSKLGPKVVVPFPAVRQFTAQRDPIGVDGGLIYNVDPRGNWSFRVSSKGMNGIGGEWLRATTIKQIILHLRVVCVVDPANDTTWWNSEDRL